LNLYETTGGNDVLLILLVFFAIFGWKVNKKATCEGG